VIVPPHDFTRAWVPVVVEFIVIRFHAVPFTVKVVTVWVVPAVNKIECATDQSSLKSANVFDHEIVFDAVLAHRENHTLL